jgi:hypothetical protein
MEVGEDINWYNIWILPEAHYFFINPKYQLINYLQKKIINENIAIL